MIKIYLELLPVFLTILTGILLKNTKILIVKDAMLILRLVFYLCLPSLILSNIPTTVLSKDFIILPLIPIIIVVFLFYISVNIGKFLKLDHKTLGVFVISSMILNTAFAFPFVISFFGNEGLSRILIIDIGNAIVVYGFAYYQACKFGNHEISKLQLIKRFIGAIPLWAIFVSLILNFSGYSLPSFFVKTLKIFGDMTIPLLLISVGVLFDPKMIRASAMFFAIFIRMGLGMLMGLLLANLFGFQGLTYYVTILATATPIGYNTLTFSSIEKLDSEFAAALISVSILIALVYVPVILYFMIP
jgi:predicted permease